MPRMFDENPFLVNRPQPKTQDLVGRILGGHDPEPPQEERQGVLFHALREVDQIPEEPEDHEDDMDLGHEFDTWLQEYLTSQVRMLKRFFRRGGAR